MDNISSLDLLNKSTLVNNTKKILYGINTNQFEELLAKRMNTQSIDALYNEIEQKYNAKLCVNSFSSYMDFMNSTDANSLNNVLISKSTLEKMKNNPAFKEKICNIINENCSQSALNELRSLTPPVKSSGVIIYPDGTYLCWVESINNEKSVDTSMKAFTKMVNSIKTENHSKPSLELNLSNSLGVIVPQHFNIMKVKKFQKI